MAKLHDWQKIRRARPGWVYAVGKARTIGCWEWKPESDGQGYRRKLRLKRQGIYEVKHVQLRAQRLWIRNGAHLLALDFEDARLSGGIFPDRLRAEVALRSGALT